jgi:glycosyltransferase involved in cell wall biosynthesis
MTDLAVIMSVYCKDRLSFVKESVQSILSQTYTHFHYYIVFDGDVDTEIDTYISSLEDNRIRLFWLDKNTGLAGALNYLLEIVLKEPEYKLIARMDSDDISLPERFEIQYNFFKNNIEVAIAGSWYSEIDESGKVISHRKLPVIHEELKKRYYKQSPFPHPSVMYRRSFIEQAGFYPTDTILMEDNSLWGKAFASGLRFANIPEYLLNYRIDAGFYSRRSGLRYGWNFIKTKFKIINYLDFPAYTYCISFFIGIIKMMPPVILKKFYNAARHF